jgi:accC: acetyl-CoA carboxylase, biotin carboxylase subunit
MPLSAVSMRKTHQRTSVHVLEELPICIFQVEKVFVLTVQSTVDVKYPHTMILWLQSSLYLRQREKKQLQKCIVH